MLLLCCRCCRCYSIKHWWWHLEAERKRTQKCVHKHETKQIHQRDGGRIKNWTRIVFIYFASYIHSNSSATKHQLKWHVHCVYDFYTNSNGCRANRERNTGQTDDDDNDVDLKTNRKKRTRTRTHTNFPNFPIQWLVAMTVNETNWYVFAPCHAAAAAVAAVPHTATPLFASLCHIHAFVVFISSELWQCSSSSFSFWRCQPLTLNTILSFCNTFFIFYLSVCHRERGWGERDRG